MPAAGCPDWRNLRHHSLKCGTSHQCGTDTPAARGATMGNARCRVSRLGAPCSTPQKGDRTPVVDEHTGLPLKNCKWSRLLQGVQIGGTCVERQTMQRDMLKNRRRVCLSVVFLRAMLDKSDRNAIRHTRGSGDRDKHDRTHTEMQAPVAFGGSQRSAGDDASSSG